MPTNLKSLISRSRSRNELKTREKEDSSTTANVNDSGSHNGANGCSCNFLDPSSTAAAVVCEGSSSCGHGEASNCNHNTLSYGCDQLRLCDTDRNVLRPLRTGVSEDPAGLGTKNTISSNCCCGHNLMSTSTLGLQNSPDVDFTNGTKKNGNKQCCGHCITSPSSPLSSSSAQMDPVDSARSSLAMRKCETVLTLSSFTGAASSCGSVQMKNATSTFLSPSSSGGGSSASEKAKVMKNKILSTSSSTLNYLVHSSSRSKLFSSWKLSSANNSNNSSAGTGNGNSSEYPEFMAHHHSNRNIQGRNGNTDVQQIFKSQLSIPESNVGTVPMTPLNRLRRNISVNGTFFPSAGTSYSRSSSVASFVWRDNEDGLNEILCRLCLSNVRMEDTVEISACSCRYCKECITEYICFEIQEGAEEIACPDAGCEKQGALSLTELERLVSLNMMDKHKKFRLYREVEKDGHLMWCPSPGCETVCRIQESVTDVVVEGKIHKSRGISSNKSLTINCTTCRKNFCAECKLSFHSGTSCEAFRRKLIKQGKLIVDDEELFAIDSIKKCPFCHVPIEKDSGCAQMMCKKCKHVFCWYCLASLDDDFLLRHYDKGPCKNKLGHSRASVVWHRAQVIGIFAGFGVLLLIASPILILAAPCLLCCRCRYCANKDPEETPAVSSV